MAITEKLQILITADGRGAQQEFNKLGASAEKNLSKTDDRLAQLSGQMVSFGATTLVAGGVAAAGLYKLAQAAGDLEESQNKANVVLGKEGAAALEEFAQGAAKAAGLSERAATDAGSSFAIFGKSAGLSGQGLADFSVELTQLAGDLASFNNTTTDEAVIAIGAALRGESEPIRKYGVLLDDATLKAEALEMGIYDGSGALSQQQRVLAAQAQILKQTTDAQGDFGRTSDSLANQQRILAAEFENTKASIGEALLPAFQSVVGGLADVAGGFNALPESAKGVIGSIAGIATAGTVAVGGLSLLVGAGLKVSDTFGEFKTRVNSGEGALGRLGGTLRDADGGLTSVGKAAQFAGIALAGLAALAAADEIRRGITNEASKAATALKELQVAAGESADGTSEAILTAFSKLAGSQSDNIFTEIPEVFGKNLSVMPGLASETVEDIERAFESLSLTEQQSVIDALREYGTTLDVGSRAAKDNADLLGNLEGRYRLNGDAAKASASGVNELTGATEDNADSTVDAKDAADALKGALTKLSAGQKLANLQFDVGAKRAEAFGDAIERSTNADDLLGSAVGAGRALNDLRETLGLLPKESDKAEEASKEATKTLERLADAASAADPALSDLGISMDAAAAGADAFNRSLASASGFGTWVDAALDLGSAFKDMDKSARRLPKTLDLTALAFGELRPRQMDAIKDLRALGAATGDYLTQMLKSGASQDQVRGQAALFRAELEEQLRAANLSEEAIAQYIEAASLAPAQIETAIKLSGVEQSRFKLDAYLQLLEGKIPPEVATQVIASIESNDLEGAATTLKNFSKTNPVKLDFSPEGVDKLDEAVGKITDLPRRYDPLVAATGGYTEAQYDALDAVLGLGDAYKDTLSQLASTDEPRKAIDWAADMREEFAKTVEGLNLTEDELHSYYGLLGIAPEQVETAVRISVDDAELFALTTTIDLLTSMNGLSPEVQLQLSDALLRNDYDEVRRLLEQTVTAELAANGAAALDTFFAFSDTVTGAKPTTTIGVDDTEARSKAAQLFFDIQRLNPTMSVNVIANFADFASQFPLFGNGFIPTAGNRTASGPNPGPAGPLSNQQRASMLLGGADGDPTTPRRKGGPVAPGRPYLVGEEGPEIVQFGAIGNVIPAGPTAEIMQPTSPLGNDKGQAALLRALSDLAARMPEGGDKIEIYGAVDQVATAEEILRTKRANRYLAGR